MKHDQFTLPFLDTTIVAEGFGLYGGFPTAKSSAHAQINVEPEEAGFLDAPVPTQPSLPAQDYRLVGDRRLAERWKGRAEDNLAAIRLITEPSERRLFRRTAYDLSLSKRTRHPMSKIDRHSDLTPSPEEQRILMRALGCGVEELVARFGAENAIKRVETELRHAKRARSRKLHAFWSAVLVKIETETDERRNTKPARSTRHMAG